MKPDPRFQSETAEFWALVRCISESLGYSIRAKRGDSERSLRRFTSDELAAHRVTFAVSNPTIARVRQYLNYRAEMLEGYVRGNLMSRDQAKGEFTRLKKEYKPKCNLPFNKQKGKKRHRAFLSCIVNMIAEHHLGETGFVDNPRRLATVRDRNGKLVKTLSRRVDGAYPSLENPSAIWEIKEYYGTTTFGSRVADGVYETQLDGYEIREAERSGADSIQHYLFVDDLYTWWDCGRSYLCRLVDATHMGLVDEVIYGRELLSRWPAIVKSWLDPSPSQE